MPPNIRAEIGPKTTITRRGLIPLFGKTIDPGFKGVLILGYFNGSPIPQVIKFRETPICKVEFYQLDPPVSEDRLVKAPLEQQEGKIPLGYFEDFYKYPEFNPLDFHRRISDAERFIRNFKSVAITILVIVVLGIIVGVSYTVLAEFVKSWLGIPQTGSSVR